MFYRQFFEFGVIHGDPNPANFRVRDNGDIVVFDFGAVKHFTEQYVSDYRNHIQAILCADYARADHYLERIGVRVPGEEFTPELYQACGRFFDEVRASQAHDMATSTLHERFLDIARVLLRYPGRFQPSPHTALFDRAHTGLYTNTRTLGAVIPVFGVFDEYLKLPQLGDEDYGGRSHDLCELNLETRG